MPNRVFISYRRSDSQHAAGRIAERLIALYGRENVFIDVGAIRPGTDFLEAIQQAIRESHAMVTIVGPRWLGGVDPSGVPRIHSPDDPVRLEIGQALEHNLPVLPVLVENAEMPPPDSLPHELAPWVRRHAIDVDHATFDEDVKHMMQAIEQMVGAAGGLGGESGWPVGYGSTGAAAPTFDPTPDERLSTMAETSQIYGWAADAVREILEPGEEPKKMVTCYHGSSLSAPPRLWVMENSVLVATDQRVAWAKISFLGQATWRSIALGKLRKISVSRVFIPRGHITLHLNDGTSYSLGLADWQKNNARAVAEIVAANR